MEIEKLQSFIEVCNCRSISRAAQKLFLSQSALSRRIQSLEAELKLQLFVRDGTVLTPTEGAKVLYKEANKILRQHDAAVIKMNKLRNGTGGLLRIGLLDSMAIRPTMHAISAMQEQYPDVELSFDCDKNTEVPYRLLEQQIDVGITVYGEVYGIEGMRYEILGANTLAVLVGRNHRLWKKHPLCVEDLAGENMYYLVGRGELSVASVEQYVKNKQIQLSDRIPCRSVEELLLYLATGKGVAFSAVTSNELFSAMPDLVKAVSLEQTGLKQGYAVAVYDQENAIAARFVDLLKQSWQQQQP